MKQFLRYRIIILLFIILNIVESIIAILVGAFMILTPENKFIKAKKYMSNLSPGDEMYKGNVH